MASRREQHVPCLPAEGHRSGTALRAHIPSPEPPVVLHGRLHTAPQPYVPASQAVLFLQSLGVTVSLQMPCLTCLIQDHPSSHCSSPKHLAPLLHQIFFQVDSWESGLGGRPAIPSPPAPGSVPPVPTSLEQSPPPPGIPTPGSPWPRALTCSAESTGSPGKMEKGDYIARSAVALRRPPCLFFPSPSCFVQGQQ